MTAVTLSKVREALDILGIATKDGVETVITPTGITVKRIWRDAAGVPRFAEPGVSDALRTMEEHIAVVEEEAVD